MRGARSWTSRRCRRGSCCLIERVGGELLFGGGYGARADVCFSCRFRVYGGIIDVCSGRRNVSFEESSRGLDA